MLFYSTEHINEASVSLVFTWSWTRQVGTDMRDKLSDEVLISTRQSKSTSLGKKTETTKQSRSYTTNMCDNIRGDNPNKNPGVRVCFHLQS